MQATRRVRWGAALGGAFAAELVLVVLAIAWVALYSYVLHPGETAAFYQAYAQRSSPWVSLVAGGPAFYLVCRWIGSRFPEDAWPTAMGVFGVSLAIMITLLLLASGDNPGLPSWLLAANYLSKLLACHLGGRGAQTRR